MSEWSSESLLDLIQNVPDFPQPGVMFKDITPLLEKPGAFKFICSKMRDFISPETTKLLAIESRGFLFASGIAQYMDVGVALARKPGKLPRSVYSTNYGLEYGHSTLQVHRSAIQPHDKVTIIDDVLATGGTAKAAEDLVRSAGAEVLGSCFLMELTQLQGFKKLDHQYKVLLKL